MVERPQQPAEPMDVDRPEEDLNIYDDEEGGTRVGDIYIPPPVKPHCSTESKGPRLIITSIFNENFKSYAGQVILGPFHHRFSSIIGPNGSGKSNVIDALLFVFGYRAQKIRSKNLQVLMHKSSRYPNTKKCTVAVHFEQILDREDGTVEVIPNSEIVIARTITSDNTSTYTINRRRAQFKEVSKLLKTHGVDLDHNRFLILQGEVESIAMMKPKGQTENECGMLEYLEDIVGTSRYKEPLAKINERVETLTEERMEKHNRCKLAEREMKDLEQPYNEAIEYLKLENALTRTKNLQIQKYLSEQRKKLKDFADERENIATELKSHDEHYENLKKERQEKEAIIKSEIQQYEKLCKDKDDMENKFKAALNNFTEVQTTMTATNKRRKANKTQVEKCEEKLEDLKKVPDKNEKEIAECEKKVEKLLKQKTETEETLQKNYAEIENETQPLISEREILETQLIDLKKNVDESKAALSLAKSELEILKRDETTQKRKYETLKTSFEVTRSNLDEQLGKKEELQQTIPQIREEIESKTRELAANKVEEETLRNKVLAMKAEIQERTINMQSAKSNNKVLNALMRQKLEGKIPGILGRLGDLGGIDSKYDVAISTACGRLDNIVVDTVNTAQACIEHLKRFDIGRASFIALEKVEHLRRHCENPINTPENVPRLFDLVRVEDQRVLPAFYFALRNTLVAHDLDQGTRIAYTPPRWRVVTLRGDVIETSGTMSGGGRTQIRGKMGQQVATKTAEAPNTSMPNQQDLQELQEQAEQIQFRVNHLQEVQGRLEREIYQLKNSLQKKEAEMNRIAISISSLEQQLPQVESQMKKQEQCALQTVADPVKVKHLETEIESKEKRYKESEKAAGKITTKISEINEKISVVHNSKIKSVQKKIDDLQKQINKLNANVSKLKVEITTSARNVKKTEKEIEDLHTEIKNAEETIKELNTKREQYDQEGVEWRQKIEAITKEIESARTDSSHIQKEIMNIQKQEGEGKLKRIEIEQKLQTLDKKISEVKDHMPHWQNKLKPLKLQEIPGEPDELEPLKTYSEEELNSYKLQDLQYQFSVQEEKLNAKKPNLSVIQEYTNKREVYLERVQVLEDITNKRNEMRQLYDDVRKKRYTEFMQGFHIITRKLKEMYQMITQGGDAELELVDSMDPFTEGVSFSVRPPKKTWKNISNLSGGEKTLSSLALVFALHYYKPSPLYFMDEIDAALDFKNISIVAHYIKERTKNAQFIIISLRSNMFELSDYLVGIYKVNDCTNSICIKNQEPSFAKPSQQESERGTQPISHSQANKTLQNDMFDLMRTNS